MAGIVCSKDYVVLTSGSRMKVIPFSDPTNDVVHDLKAKPAATEGNKGSKKEIGETEPGGRTAGGIDPHIPTGRILAAAFSRTGTRFAACTDQKELTVWTTQPAWTKLWTKSVTKRGMALTFDMSEAALFVADKAGDVYRYEVQDETRDSTLLLGHVSMLLDVAVSPDNKFIMTAERDEKIRVSHLPNAHSIHTYCLGHTEYVSRLAVLPDSDLLVSSAGDSTLRLWDYRTGSELCSASYDWAGSSREPREKNKATATCISCSKWNNLVAVTILKHTVVPVYQVVKQNGRWAFSEVARIECSHPPWSLTFDPSGSLLILVPDEAKSLLALGVEEQNDGSFQVIEDQSTEGATALLAQKVRDDWEFLKCSSNVQSIYQGLHKVPFDNMPDYLQRKQQRIETNQARRGNRRQRRAQKNKKGQKRSSAEVVAAGNGEQCKRTLIDDDEVEEDDDEEEEEDDVDCVEGVEESAVTS